MQINKESIKLRDIYFAGGCFWGVEEYFSRIPGVMATTAGYANGITLQPSYEDVCSGTTGFAEAVKVEYDPSVITLRTLTEQYFKIIDPVSVNKQGNDTGNQYRTGIYYTHDHEKMPLQLVMNQIQKEYKTPLAVELVPIRNFYPAEEYHQDYLQKNPTGYCHINFSSLNNLVIREDGTAGIRRSKEELQKKLSKEQYKVIQASATEAPYTGEY